MLSKSPCNVTKGRLRSSSAASAQLWLVVRLSPGASEMEGYDSDTSRLSRQRPVCRLTGAFPIPVCRRERDLLPRAFVPDRKGGWIAAEAQPPSRRDRPRVEIGDALRFRGEREAIQEDGQVDILSLFPSPSSPSSTSSPTPPGLFSLSLPLS